MLISRLFHEGAERIEGSCRDNMDMIKEGGFACVTEDLSAKSIYSSDFTNTGKCNFYVTEPVKTFNYGMTFPVSCSLKFLPQVNLSHIPEGEPTHQRV